MTSITFTDYAKNILKQNGYRITRPRELVLEHLRLARQPMNPYDIKKKIAHTDNNVDTVTIYRILKVYSELGLVHETREGYMPCQEHQCQDLKHCHHQFVCEKCQQFQEIHLSDQSFIQQINKKFPHLKIQSHYFEFSGFCESCKSNS